MMGHQPEYQRKLFIAGFSLDRRVRKDHILRKIAKKIDFNFTCEAVEHTYGTRGNVSVPPPVILKMMLLLVLYNVRSERELMITIPERLDWLWFLGYDLDDEIPDHSVLSKARARWGVVVFERFFKRIVRQCVEEGLIDGSKLFTDSSFIDADASNNSVVDTARLSKYFDKGYRELEKRLKDIKEEKQGIANQRYLSTTDPDASVMRHKGGKARLRYKTHRAVDGEREVITSTKITSGAVDDSHVLEETVKLHEDNTGRKVETVVADSKYGTADNYLFCYGLGIKAHIPSLKKTHKGTGRQKGIYSEEAFTYDPERDVFICPAGHTLEKRSFYKNRQSYEYRAEGKVCMCCHLRHQCTRAKSGRSLKRHLRQEELDRMFIEAESRRSKRDLKTRQHLGERSFAASKQYGYKRARWRGLWRMEIQDYLISAVLNITKLVKYSRDVMPGAKGAEIPLFQGCRESMREFFRLFLCFGRYNCFGKS
jgi:transposase